MATLGLILIAVGLGQFFFPDILKIVDVPVVRVDGEKGYFFVLRSFVSFLLSIAEYIKAPLFAGYLFVFVDNYSINNLLLTIFFISLAFPWHKRFKLTRIAVYALPVGGIMNIYSLSAVVLSWGGASLLRREKGLRDTVSAGVLFIFSLYTNYYPAMFVFLLLQGACFYQNRKSQPTKKVTK